MKNASVIPPVIRSASARLLGLAALLAVSAVTGCMPSLNRISTRNPDLFDKESDHVHARSRPVGSDAAPEIFVRQKQVVIKKADEPNETGSLFNPDDERNYLFTATGPFNVGRYINVKIVSNRPAAGGAGAGTGAGGAAPAEGQDEVEADLLRALPDLAPADPGSVALQKAFKMKIAHRYDNGDVMAMMTRRSIAAGDGNELTIQARIPYERLASGDDLTTDDLTDVRYLASADGELAERYSSGWEDEYSLRMSGFDEAKSKAARELADKQKKMDEARGKLETQIKSFGDERRNVAKQREDLTKKSASLETEKTDMQTKISTQEQTISKQQEEIVAKDKEIQQLNSMADKPGDKKNGG